VGRKLALGLLLIGGLLAGRSAALENQGLFLSEVTPQQYAANNSLKTSTHSVSGILTSFMINPVGSSCTYHLDFATATFMNTGTGALTYSRVVSSEATIPANMILSDTMKIEMWNPKIVISGLATGATIYIWMDYGQAKTGWGGN
jgi:hypothetical protein